MDALIIDGSNITHRAFAATMRDESTDPAVAIRTALGNVGQWVGRCNLVPGRVFVCFDGEDASARRRAIDESYKAHRPAKDSRLADVLAGVRDGLAELGYRVTCVPGYEADDVIATYARLLSHRGFHNAILSGDKDVLQALGPYTTVLLITTTIKDATMYDVEVFGEKYGFPSTLFAEYKALCGDESDNIMGARGELNPATGRYKPGIGPKMAAELLGNYGGLGNIYTRVQRGETMQSNRVMRLLRDNRERVYTNLLLTTLDSAVPGVALRGE